jgi:phosphatidate cytidylyltransferase
MKRILTAAVGVPFVIVVTLYAPDLLFGAVVAAFAALATHEFFKLGEAKGIGCPGSWFLIPVALVNFSFLGVDRGSPRGVLTVLAVSILALMTSAVFRRPIEQAFGVVAIGLSGLAYCGIALGFLLLIPREEIMMLFAIIWVGDSAAYYGGRIFGKHLLAPRISPKKTVEGAVAGLIGSIAAGVIAGEWLVAEPWTSAVLISGVTAVAGQVGDLAESVLKRSTGVKDSSSILPGHGGILDRLDSLFFAAPVFYLLFTYL